MSKNIMTEEVIICCDITGIQRAEHLLCKVYITAHCEPLNTYDDNLELFIDQMLIFAFAGNMARLHHCDIKLTGCPDVHQYVKCDLKFQIFLACLPMGTLSYI